MGNNLETELRQAAASTFEDLGFMFPSDEMEDGQANLEFEAASCVEFKGPFKGRLVVSISGKMMEDLASNMLGQDEPPTVQQRFDALGEMTNIICGNVLPKIAGYKEVFNIDAPQFVDSKDKCCGNDEKPSAEISLSFDEGRADVMLFTYGEIQL